MGFPSHGVIARPSERADGLFFKDLTDPVVLQEALAACRRLDSQGQFWLEIDMRAHRNPTRMRSIRRLGVALVRRLCAPCPGCGSPGWGGNRSASRAALPLLRDAYRSPGGGDVGLPQQPPPGPAPLP